jgi:hypothetical protein
VAHNTWHPRPFFLTAARENGMKQLRYRVITTVCIEFATRRVSEYLNQAILKMMVTHSVL